MIPFQDILLYLFQQHPLCRIGKKLKKGGDRGKMSAGLLLGAHVMSARAFSAAQGFHLIFASGAVP